MKTEDQLFDPFTITAHVEDVSNQLILREQVGSGDYGPYKFEFYTTVPGAHYVLAVWKDDEEAERTYFLVNAAKIIQSLLDVYVSLVEKD